MSCCPPILRGDRERLERLFRLRQATGAPYMEIVDAMLMYPTTQPTPCVREPFELPPQWETACRGDHDRLALRRIFLRGRTSVA